MLSRARRTAPGQMQETFTPATGVRAHAIVGAIRSKLKASDTARWIRGMFRQWDRTKDLLG